MPSTDIQGVYLKLCCAFGLTNLPFDVGRISGEATPSDKNNEFTRNNPTYRIELSYENANQESLEDKPEDLKNEEIQDLAVSKADKRKVPRFDEYKH